MISQAETATPTPRALLWLVALGAVLRLLYLGEHAVSAFFRVYLLDATYYDTVARALLEDHDLTGINPGFRPLLYPACLAVCYALVGAAGDILAILVQHALGIATAVGVAFFAARLTRRPSAGAVAALLYLLAPPPLYFEGELLIATLATFAAAVLLWLLARADESASPVGWVLAGAWVGVAAQARPNVLLVAGGFILAALWPRGALFGTPRKARSTLAISALAGMAGALVVVGILQMPVFGYFQWLGGSGGVNLYLGNKRGADGMIPRQDRPTTYGGEYRDSVQVFATQTYLEAKRAEGVLVAGAPPPGKVSRFWMARTAEEIRADPQAWLSLMVRKASFLMWDREIPNNKNLAFVREHESVLLRWLPVRWWWLMALAPLGIAFAWHRGDRRTLWWALVFAALYSFGVLLFFVNSRFRLPLWPVATALAAGGVLFLADAMGDAWRARHRGAWQRLAFGLAVVGLGATASLVNWFGVPAESYARDFFFRSVAALEKGWVEQAESDARAAVDLDPDDAASWFQLGSAALAAQRWEEALVSLGEAAARRPDEPRIANNLGVAYDALGRPAEAYRAYIAAIDKRSDYPPPWVNAALLELRAGRLDLASERLDRARELGFDSLSAGIATAFVARARGDQERAERLLAAAREVDAALVERLEEEQAQPLDPVALGLANLESDPEEGAP